MSTPRSRLALLLQFEPLQRFEYHLDDGRAARIDLIDHGDGTVSVREALDAGR